SEATTRAKAPRTLGPGPCVDFGRHTCHHLPDLGHRRCRLRAPVEPTTPRAPGTRTLVLVLAGVAAGAIGVRAFSHRAADPTPPPTPLVVDRMREVARLETLDLQVYKKISYAPEPAPTGALWSDVLAWAKSSLFPSHGRAIVFGTVHLGLDLSKLDARRVRVDGGRIEVALPPMHAQVELRPGGTEIIASNLGSGQTAQLL